MSDETLENPHKPLTLTESMHGEHYIRTREVPAGFYSLLESNHQIRRSFLENGTYEVRTSYKPTNWDKEDSDKVYWDGLREQDGTCPKCFMRRTRTGACSIDCVGDPSHPNYEG